jgi:GYF domain 2
MPAAMGGIGRAFAQRAAAQFGEGEYAIWRGGIAAFGGRLMSKWYVAVEGQARGPVSTETVLAYLETRNRAEIYVWREGFDDWHLAKDIPELRGAGPPPVPLIAVPDAEFVPAKAKPQRKSRKARWFKIGAIIGLVYALVGIAAGLPSQQNAFFLGGYILGGVCFLGLVGFIAGVIADLIHRPAKTGSASPEKAVFAVEPVIAPGDGNFIVRHWRGELPLWVSYWVINFLGNLCAVAVPILLAAVFASKSGYYPLSVFATLIGTWVCVLVLACWQLVGTWRSARRYSSTRRQQGRHAFWGGLAQAAVIFGVFASISSIVRDGVPQIIETWRVAFQNDPDIPDYSIRVMRDGTEAEIVGGLKYGLTDDFLKILGASRRVKVVHLNSIGGRIGEGEKLFDIIRSRGLTTYVSSECMSACTLAFAGGRERYLRKGAVLGFHKGAFPGINDDGLDDGPRAIFARAGFDPEFIAKALSTPNANMYKPEPRVLLAAHVITGVTDGNQFAISGLGTELSKEDIALSLSKALPVFEAMKERFPRSYDSFVDEYHQGVVRGKSEAETIENARAKLIPFIRQLIPLADDDVLVDYVRILIDQYTVLNERDPTACYLYASGTGSTNRSWRMPPDLQARELAVEERVIRTAVKRPTIDQKVKETLWDKVRTRLRSSGVTESDLEIMGAETVDASKHALYCALNIAMFREIARLPQREGAMLMRTVFLEE